MIVLKADTGREIITQAARAALKEGAEVSPRGYLTRELRPGVMEVGDPTDVLPTGINRGSLNPAIGAAEALQLIAGASYPELMVRVAKKFADFINPETRKFDGAYGPRVEEQIPYVIERLQADPDTRQAIAVIYDPADTHSRPKSLDYPCTLNLHFLVRDGKLCCHVNMRSNDIWLGLSYDMFQFTQLQCTVARALDLPVGNYIHVSNSLHLYEFHFDAADQLIDDGTAPLEAYAQSHLNGIGRTGDSWQAIRRRANSILTGMHLEQPTATETWYQQVMRPYVGSDGEN